MFLVGSMLFVLLLMRAPKWRSFRLVFASAREALAQVGFANAREALAQVGFANAREALAQVGFLQAPERRSLRLVFCNF